MALDKIDLPQNKAEADINLAKAKLAEAGLPCVVTHDHDDRLRLIGAVRLASDDYGLSLTYPTVAIFFENGIYTAVVSDMTGEGFEPTIYKASDQIEEVIQYIIDQAEKYVRLEKEIDGAVARLVELGFLARRGEVSTPEIEGGVGRIQEHWESEQSPWQFTIRYEETKEETGGWAVRLKGLSLLPNINALFGKDLNGAVEFVRIHLQEYVAEA